MEDLPMRQRVFSYPIRSFQRTERPCRRQGRSSSASFSLRILTLKRINPRRLKHALLEFRCRIDAAEFRRTLGLKSVNLFPSLRGEIMGSVKPIPEGYHN